jgi:hypothetical protein
VGFAADRYCLGAYLRPAAGRVDLRQFPRIDGPGNGEQRFHARELCSLCRGPILFLA